MMFVGLIALTVIGGRSPEGRMADLVVGSKFDAGRWRSILADGRWLFPFPPIVCCLFGNLHAFLGTLAIFGTLILLSCGRGDSRYAANKFAVYHFFALLFYLCARAIAGGGSGGSWIAAFHAVAFGILLPVYPFNGWCDVFFIRAPFAIVAPWLIVVRPIAIGFLCAIAPALRTPVGGIVSTVLVYGSLYFVPILFFAEADRRRTLARIVCWQSGYIWLFVGRFPGTIDARAMTLLALAQGIFIGIVLKVADAPTAVGGGIFEKFRGLFERNYFFASFALSSMALLTLLPIAFALKNDAAAIPPRIFYEILGSMALPALFCVRLYRSMASPLPAVGDCDRSSPETDGT
jgi:hypothetical protein